MTRLASTGVPSSMRSTAAEVSSQLVSMPRMRLVTTELFGDDALVGRRAPGVFTDHLLHDDPVLVEQKALGHARGLIDPLDPAALIVQHLEGQPQLPHEVLHVLRGSLVDA